VTRFAVDGNDFLRPEGYYRDSHDLERFRAAGRTLVAGGVFLQRPELDDLWDVRIWLDISFDAEWMPELRSRYEERYFPAQRLYIGEVDPRSHAEIVVAS
jgi:hypothetical protein